MTMISELRLRPATMDDKWWLFVWRNDADTRANSINTEPVLWEDHVAWLERSLANPDRELLIAEVGHSIVGTVRVDDGTEVSWTVCPIHRGQGYGKAMVRLIAKPGHLARIKQTNVASQRIAEGAGFRLVNDGELQEWVR